MNRNRFDSLTRLLAAALSRRTLVFALTSGGLAAVVGWPRGVADVEAKNAGGKKRNKKKEKKPQLLLNAFGCLDVGQPCQGNSANCCSGICEGIKPRRGKKDQSKCASHNTGICAADSDLCTSGLHHACHPSNPNCTCTLTTGNAGFCADFTSATGQEVACRVCTKDTDCQAEFGAGAACLVMGGICAASCPGTGGTACAPPCA